MSNKIKAVLFDMDGVLIDAKDWHYEALNRALALFGMEISRYDHLVTYDGLPTKKKLEMLSMERGLPVALHRFLDDLKQKFTMELIATRCRPTFAHQYALAKLRSQGMRLAVCSNSVRSTIELMMHRAALIEHLEFFLSNQDVSKGKPDPEIYVKAINRLGLQAGQCLIVEDNPNGIAAAKASGAFVLEVASVADVNLENIHAAISRFEETIIC
jgi:HAD superfamily hydrolase (TIGR01509 family)